MNYQSARETFYHINNLVSQLGRTERSFLIEESKHPEFMQTGESKYLTESAEIVDSIRNKMKDLGEHKTAFGLNIDKHLNEITTSLTRYSQKLNQLALNIRNRRFYNLPTQEEPIAADHYMEQAGFPYNGSLTLLLRIYKKDFLLTGDPSYQSKFENTVQEFKSAILRSDVGSLSGISVTERDELLKWVDNYQHRFNQIIKTEQEIGLNEKEGLQGELRKVALGLSHRLEAVNNDLSSAQEEINFTVLFQGILIFIFSLTTGALLGVIFSNRLSNRISLIRDSIVKLSEGDFPEKRSITGQDELIDIQQAVNDLTERIKSAADFAKKIGDGELDLSNGKNLNQGVLEEALLTMHEKLQDSMQEDEKRNWVVNGLAKFSEILGNDLKDLTSLSQTIIRNLIKYLGINQGGLFIVKDNEENETYLELMACYAWEREKYTKKKIRIGEGLTGQCWQEKQEIYLTDLPDNYIKITSGLGQTNPGSILIVPLKVQEEVFGVIELASLNEFQDYQREFILKLAENIASTLSSVKVNSKTLLLLEQFQTQAEVMRTQEEEMRQNTEELKVTQENLNKKLKEIEAEKQKNMAILEGSVDGVISFDMRGIIDFVNNASEEILCLDRSEIIGRNIDEFMPVELNINGHGKAFYTSSNGSKEIEVRTEMAFKNRFDEEVEVLGTLSLAKVEDNTYYTLFLQNITVDLF